MKKKRYLNLVFFARYGIIGVQRKTQDIVKYFSKNTKYCEKVADIHFENNKKVKRNIIK